MKKRMRILTFLLAGAMVFTGTPGTGMLAAAAGTVAAEAAEAAGTDTGGGTATVTIEQTKWPGGYHLGKAGETSILRDRVISGYMTAALSIPGFADVPVTVTGDGKYVGLASVTWTGETFKPEVKLSVYEYQNSIKDENKNKTPEVPEEPPVEDENGEKDENENSGGAGQDEGGSQSADTPADDDVTQSTDNGENQNTDGSGDQNGSGSPGADGEQTPGGDGEQTPGEDDTTSPGEEEPATPGGDTPGEGESGEIDADEETLTELKAGTDYTVQYYRLNQDGLPNTSAEMTNGFTDPGTYAILIKSTDTYKADSIAVGAENKGVKTATAKNNDDLPTPGVYTCQEVQDESSGSPNKKWFYYGSASSVNAADEIKKLDFTYQDGQNEEAAGDMIAVGSGLDGELLIRFTIDKIDISGKDADGNEVVTVSAANSANTIKASNAADAASLIVQEADGTNKMPAVIVKWGQTTLKESTDYSLGGNEFSAVVTRGPHTGVVSIPEDRHASLEGTKEFAYYGITTVDTSNIIIDYQAVSGATGKFTPSVIVSKDNETFINRTGGSAKAFLAEDATDAADTGYTVKYYTVDSSGRKGSEITGTVQLTEGDYIAEITGTGFLHMAGNANQTAADNTITKTFSVDPNAIDLSTGVTVDYPYSGNPYTGTAVRPEVQVQDKTTNKLLAEGTDYTLLYTNNTDARQGELVYGSSSPVSDALTVAPLRGGKKLQDGAPTITVVGKGNYKGTLKYGFEIAPAGMADVEITGVNDVTFDPMKVSMAPAVKVTLKSNGRTVPAANAYALSIREAKQDTAGEWQIDQNNTTDYATTSLNKAGTFIVTVTNTRGGNLSADYGTSGKSVTMLYTVNKADISQYVGKVNNGATVYVPAEQAGNSINWKAYDKPYTSGSTDNVLGVELKKTASGGTLNYGTDYKVDAATFTAGKQTVIFQATSDNYTGSLSVDYTVIQELGTEAVNVYMEVNGSTYTPHVAVTDGNSQMLTEGTDYTVKFFQGSKGNEGGKAPATARGTEVTTIRDLTKDYYAEVTPAGFYIADVDEESDNTVVRKKLVFPQYDAAKDLSKATVTVRNIGRRYLGTPWILKKTQDVTVKIGNTTVPENSYLLLFKDNINAGTATVTAIPASDSGYTGMKEAEFTIDATSLPALDSKTLTYDGTAKVFQHTFTEDQKTVNLKAGTDYTVEYYKAVLGGQKGETPQLNSDGRTYQKGDKVTELVDAGKYIAVATGTGNYKDTSEAVMEIAPAAFSVFGKFDRLEDTKYNGEAQIPVVTYTDSKGARQTLDESLYTYVLRDSKGYMLPEAKQPGTYTVELTGTGTFISKEATTSVTWTITKIPVSDLTVEVGDAKLAADGGKVEPEVTVTCSDLTIDPSEYTISYFNNTEPGTGVVKVTAKEDSQILEAGSSVTVFAITQEGVKTPEELMQELEEANQKLQDELNKNTANEEKINSLTAQIEELGKKIEAILAQPQPVAQKITVAKKARTFKAANLKKKKATFQVKAIAQTTVKYKKLKTNKHVTMNAKGLVTVKKGTKAGTYKLKVQATAVKSYLFKKATKNFMVKVTVK